MRPKVLFLSGLSTNATKATPAEVLAGTDDTKYVTSLGAAGITSKALGFSATRQTAPYLLGDGLVNDYTYYPTSAAGAIGTGDFTFICKIKTPTTAELSALTNARGGIGSLMATLRTPANNDLRSIIFSYSGNNYLQFILGSTSNNKLLTVNTFLSTYGEGVWLPIVLRRAAGVMSAFVGGTQATVTPGTNGSPASDWSDSINFGNVISGSYGSDTGSIKARGAPQLFNAAFTPAEILTHAQTGLLPDWCAFTGSAVPVYISDFSSGKNGWNSDTPIGGDQGTGNIDADADGTGIPPTNDWLRFKRGTGQGTGQLYEYHSTFSPPGSRVRVSGQLFTAVGSPITYVVIAHAGTPLSSTPDTDRFVVTLTPGTVLNFSGSLNIPTASGPVIQVVTDATGNTAKSVAEGTALYMRGITFTKLGPIADHVLGPNYSLRDRGSNGLHGVRSSSTTYVGPAIDDSPAFVAIHSASGNIQFAGGAALDSAKGWAIDRIIVNSTAAVTWSLGNAASGKQYIADYVLAVGDNVIPVASLVTQKISGANLWSIASAAATITIFPRLLRTT